MGIRHIESGGIGYEDGYTTLEAFFSQNPDQQEVITFLDARAHLFNNWQWAANVGVGLRRVWGERVVGINAYYDYRNTHRLSANQIGIGLETLGELADFRINGYWPLGKRLSSPYDALFTTFSGHYALVSQKYHSAMRGADAEVGFHLGSAASALFYAGVGPYYFTGKIDPDTLGGKARLSATFREMLTLEISDSYDRTFHNKFQGQVSLHFSFGPKATRGGCCAERLICRMLQPVYREEILVIDKRRAEGPAIDPLTGLPYFFVFVDNTSSSNGTYESPYSTLAQAQDNSSPHDILYVFPGDGTTTGMDAGIFLQAGQKLWGSGVSQVLPTSGGTCSIPAQTATSPRITNADVDTEGNAVTLATNNALSGLILTSALNDAIYGVNPHSLDVTSCLFENNTTFAVEASFSGEALVSLTNNQFLDNVNGVSLTLNGTSSLFFAGNRFEGQTSVSNVPIEISAESNSLSARIENNLFNGNTTGSVRFNFTDIVRADISLLDNTISNNGTGAQSTLGSACVVLANGTCDTCAIALEGNTFSNNASNALYMHTSGQFTTLDIALSHNTMSTNGGSALVLATPTTQTLTLLATENTIAGCGDNAIGILGSASTANGNITINNNTITDVGNSSNGIDVHQDFSQLALTISSNQIRRCEGTGIITYAPTQFDALSLDISDNTIADCQNLASNSSSGLDIEQFINLTGSVTNNIFSGNSGTAVMVGSALPAPVACLALTGNDSSSDYLLVNPVDGTFYLSPCDVDFLNVGAITTSGTIDLVQSCATLNSCAP